jgi:hypothetical protein
MDFGMCEPMIDGALHLKKFEIAFDDSSVLQYSTLKTEHALENDLSSRDTARLPR